MNRGGAYGRQGGADPIDVGAAAGIAQHQSTRCPDFTFCAQGCPVRAAEPLRIRTSMLLRAVPGPLLVVRRAASSLLTLRHLPTVCF